MSKFETFFHMEPSDVLDYVVEILHFFSAGEPLDCQEIGDGNINYVFRVRSRRDGRSVVVKQADKLLRTSGRPLDLHRSQIEAEALRTEARLAPRFIPQVFHYDETMAALCMEDISAYRNLRKELAAGRIYRHLSDNLSSFLAETLLPTTDLVMDRQEKKKRVVFFTNPELCDITEDLVLTEPYWNYKQRNIVSPGNEAFVRELLYENPALHAQVGLLRNNFMNNAQALIHGDLHSGSIFVNEEGLKVIDPEFAFYGPMGYDIGNVIGNLFLAWGNRAFTAPETTEELNALEKAIRETWDWTFRKLEDQYRAIVPLGMYQTDGFRRAYRDSVLADACGYAGTEIIRRIVGDSKVSEITSVTNPAIRLPMERALLRMGVRMILERGKLRTGSELTTRFKAFLPK